MIIEPTFAAHQTEPAELIEMLDLSSDPDPAWLAEIAATEAAAEGEPIQDLRPALAELPANEFLWIRLADTGPRTVGDRLARVGPQPAQGRRPRLGTA